jgi:hypothetical protein
LSKPSRRIEFDEGLALGLIIAYVAAGAVFGLTQDFSIKADVLTPILTLGAALVTVYFSTRAIRRQIASDEERHDNVRKGQYIAARARLASSLSDTVEELNKALLQILHPTSAYSFSRQILDQLDERLESCITHSNDETSMHLASLMMRMQIIVARYKRLVTSAALLSASPTDDVISVNGVFVRRTEAFLDILHFRQSILNTFNFARLKNEKAHFHSALSGEMVSAMAFLDFTTPVEHHPLYSSLRERANAIYAKPLENKDASGLPIDITAE